MTSIILSTICALALNAAPLSAPADTIIAYAIDGQKIEHFDGSQLIGKKISSYEIVVLNLQGASEPTLLHSIITEEGAKNAPPVTISFRKVDTTDVVFVVDGIPVSEEEFQQLDPKKISGMNIFRDSTAEDILRKLKEEGKYSGATEGHGVVEVIMKKDSK
jgi:hypothetical protein